jgi:hypothetical protein
VSQSDPKPHADPKTSPDHELTPMEGFFDNLFNHHMVLPQPPEELPPIKGLEGHDRTQETDAFEPD